MSLAKTKEVVKLAIKEGSINIAVLTISSIAILLTVPNPFIQLVIQVAWTVGFGASIGIVIYRIGLNQYLVSKARIAQANQNIKQGDFDTLIKKDTLIDVAMPFIQILTSKLQKKFDKNDIDINLDDIIKELEDDFKNE